MNLGGRDIDEVIVEHCLAQFKAQTGHDLSENKKARTRLFQECERAKIALTSAFETKVKVHSLYQDTDLEVNITRD